jgi:hypothetical protein
MNIPQVLMRPEGLGKLIKFKYLIGSRTRDLPACSMMPHPLRYRMPENKRQTVEKPTWTEP